MKALAILLDSRPTYLRRGGAAASLLLAPLGPASVLHDLGERLATVGHSRLTIATAFTPDAEYQRRILDSGVRVDAIVPARELTAHIADYEPSDWLVIVDPRCYPLIGHVPSALLIDDGGGPRRVRHLVALEAHPGGTTERVHLGANGAVGRIQRYYDSATWPFTSGVACSIVPVSCTIGAELPFASLRDLRRSLAERGVPSNDVFIRGGAFNLSRERDLLALSERAVLEHFMHGRRADADWVEVGGGVEIDSTARLVGPVIVQDGAVIGPDALVVGPAVIGPRARVERQAMVAQALVGAEAVIAPGTTVRHRAVFGTATEAVPASISSRYYYEPDPAPTVEPAEMLDSGGGRSSAVYPVLKAALDLTASALGLVLLSPILLIIAALIRLESKGAVLFRDWREGKGGRVFECVKFRTMFVGAAAQQRELLASNQVDGPQFKMAGDPRVTRIGRLLRITNLDELPQLINVLLGQMSLVGPRPSPFRENQLCIPWRHGRLSVRPGITGLWQICRHDRESGDFHQWIHFDLLYVRHRSFLVDLKILLFTLVSLGGHWPVPLTWILSRRRMEPVPASMPATAKA